MATYRQLINKAKKKANQKDISDQAVKLLMLELCNNNSTDLYLHYENQVDSEIEKKFEEAMERLLNNEPLQYILVYQWFCGYKIFVKNQDVINIADIGTGSGAIAIALKKEEEKFNMWATDISETAIQLAKQNSQYNNCSISFLIGDMLQPLIDNNIKLDILVSNPPYIPKSQKMEKSVVDYEPHVALFGGDDGLFFYRKIMENAHKVINPHSFLAFEIGYDEKQAICALVEQYFPNDRYEVLKDLNGKDRMLFIYHNL